MKSRRSAVKTAGCMALLGTAIYMQAANADDFPGIRQLMDAEEFSSSGLDKLSEKELQALNKWLITYTAGDAEILKKSNEAVRVAEKDFELESRIVGEFSGWSGSTVFRLENGQVWEQRLDGRYKYKGEANPKVRIDRNWLGFYRLTILETGRSVGVSVRGR